MNPAKVLTFFLLLFSVGLRSQTVNNYHAGFQTIHFVDSSRTYKPDAAFNDTLRFRPLDIDIWYPTKDIATEKMLFEDLFKLHEERANFYQDEEDYTGFSDELILYMAAGYGLDAKDGKRLLKIQTASYKNASVPGEKFPVVIYMAGYNGMGWENYRMLESLAENGYVVLSISSIGRYPGNMTNDIPDTMEQVLDAEFTMGFLKHQKLFDIDFENMGILGLSWGGMSGILLLDRNPDIKAMVSLDGTDNFYFGDTDEDDRYLSNIYAADLIHPGKTRAAFMHMEGGDRFDEFIPKGAYRYIDSISSPSKYLHFSHSKHEDFSSLTWALQSSKMSVINYEEMMESTNLFFNKYLKGVEGLEAYLNQLVKKEYITDRPQIYPKTETKIQSLKGSIKSQKDLSSLSFVNIGILNSEIGTVSNKKGKFELQIPMNEAFDSIRISMIGYKPKKVAIEDLTTTIDSIEIFLEEDIAELNEIVLKTKTWKKKKLGNQTISNFIGHLFYYDQLGKEMGIKLNVNKKPNFVEAFNFHISYNRFSAKSFFRLNMYEIEDGKPGKNIVNQNIIIGIEPKQTGMISIDLEPNDIVLTKDVIATLEWIDTEGEMKPTEALVISVGLFTGGVYERNSKEAKMRKRLKGMGLGFTMDVRY
ncbi:carboxypeptidase-like regulatory domain-containing protein [Lutimonas sp.]|uniref:carboxypeptidase-like regulatory domain-containing protein n=1 Tax=Lutimonas sp. TaxID=1872403 RepID=UPI003D9AD9A8